MRVLYLNIVMIHPALDAQLQDVSETEPHLERDHVRHSRHRRQHVLRNRHGRDKPGLIHTPPPPGIAFRGKEVLVG